MPLTNIPPPANWLLWTGVFAFAWKLIEWLYGRYERHRDKERSIVDEFWYRTILVPICWQPLVELITEYVARLHALAGRTLLPDATASGLRDLTLEFASDKNRIVNRFMILTIFDDEVYRGIRGHLDSLEDEVTEYLAHETHPSQREAFARRIALHTEYVESVYWARLKDVCTEMMKLHPAVKLPV